MFTKKKFIITIFTITILSLLIIIPFIRIAIGNTTTPVMDSFTKNAIHNVPTYVALFIDDIFCVVVSIMIVFTFCTLTDVLLIVPLIAIQKIGSLTGSIKSEKIRDRVETTIAISFVISLFASLIIVLYIMTHASVFIPAESTLKSLLLLSVYTIGLFLIGTIVLITKFTITVNHTKDEGDL